MLCPWLASRLSPSLFHYQFMLALGVTPTPIAYAVAVNVSQGSATTNAATIERVCEFSEYPRNFRGCGRYGIAPSAQTAALKSIIVCFDFEPKHHTTLNCGLALAGSNSSM
jgi:hypothetical protein